MIAAFGDSLTAGFGVDAGLSYPDYLQKRLDAAGYSYRVRCPGRGGMPVSLVGCPSTSAPGLEHRRPRAA